MDRFSTFYVHYALHFKTVSDSAILFIQNLLATKHAKKDSYSIVRGLFPVSGADHLQFEAETYSNTFLTGNIFKERFSEFPGSYAFKIASSLNTARKH